MKAVITVLGKDAVGILAKVSAVCAENNVNIIDVSQSTLRDIFCMIMMVEMDKSTITIGELSDAMSFMGKKNGLVISVMHEDIFNSMHRI
ncbi:MAG: ACT domain-containing protein [Clostridiales bacterium]|nr:ACT domain-containing protein [Clostridiales bacterium]